MGIKANSKILKDNLIIIPVHLPWEWSTDYYNQTAQLLSKTNTVICILWQDAQSVFELLKKRQGWKAWFQLDKTYFYTPLHILPFRRFKSIQKVNMQLNFVILQVITKWIFQQKQFKMQILWIFYPLFTPLLTLCNSSWITLYDCVDYVEDRKLRNIEEKKLLRSVTHAFANSHTLCDLHKAVRPDIHWVPQGFRIDDFKHPLPASVTFPKEKPIIGFVGGINKRLDFQLLFKLIANNPQWNFVFWGPVQLESDEDEKNIKKLLSYSNVIHGKSSDRREIASIVKQFDVCIIPYDVSQDINKYCFPMKVFEYGYFHKNIVSTKINELIFYNISKNIVSNSKKWGIVIGKYIRSDENHESLSMYNHSWNSKIKLISIFINKF